MNATLQNLEKMLATGRDSSLLRFSLGNEFSKLGQFEQAATHLQQAVTQDPNYSAAWKLLGKALSESGQLSAALSAYQSGIVAAEKRGDKQAAKEMAVFANRIQKQLAPPAP